MIVICLVDSSSASVSNLDMKELMMKNLGISVDYPMFGEGMGVNIRQEGGVGTDWCDVTTPKPPPTSHM